MQSAHLALCLHVANDGSTLCLNGGQGPVTPPCNHAEEYIPTQVNIDLCSEATTSGWQRVVA